MWVLVLVFAQQALLTEPSPPPFNTFYLLHFLTKIRLIQYCSIPKICLHIAYSVSGFIGDNISYFVPEMSLFISPLFYRDIFIRQVTLELIFFFYFNSLKMLSQDRFGLRVQRVNKQFKQCFPHRVTFLCSTNAILYQICSNLIMTSRGVSLC